METKPQASIRLRIATFNSSLNRDAAGQLMADLSSGDHQQASAVAQIIQLMAPDVLVLQEFDYDAEGIALKRFQENYLALPQGGGSPISYPYALAIPSNTGIASGMDLSGDGRVDGPADAFGFGKHPGQYAFAILSRYPIDVAGIRTFQNFLWKDMPGALLPPSQPPVEGTGWYSAQALEVLRLSSKNHVDVPVSVEGRMLHLLVAHPTPPVFDGPEDRNGRRNHDEIRLFADYISPERADYLVDDNGLRGGLAQSESFCILGDMNADPVDGDSYPGAIAQLLEHPRVHSDSATGVLVPRSAGAGERERLEGKQGDPAVHTAGWGLRVDYVLASENLDVQSTGVYWPSEGTANSTLTGRIERTPNSSDHRLVWLDLYL